MNDSMSPADYAAVSGGGFGGFGSEGLWLFAILALMGGGFGSFGGNRDRNATVGDVQRATDFAALERQNNETVAAVRQAAYDNAGAIKDGNYNILGELRDLQMATASGFAPRTTSRSRFVTPSGSHPRAAGTLRTASIALPQSPHHLRIASSASALLMYSSIIRFPPVSCRTSGNNASRADQIPADLHARSTRSKTGTPDRSLPLHTGRPSTSRAPPLPRQRLPINLLSAHYSASLNISLISSIFARIISIVTSLWMWCANTALSVASAP